MERVWHAFVSSAEEAEVSELEASGEVARDSVTVRFFKSEEGSGVCVGQSEEGSGVCVGQSEEGCRVCVGQSEEGSGVWGEVELELD